MKKLFFIIPVLLSLVILLFYQEVPSGEINKEDSFFESSLHYTTDGMGYWYNKENGGIEKLTGIPYKDLSCKNCHISSCDVCHKIETDGKFAYSNKATKNMDICLSCHAREKSIMNTDKAANQDDVHFSRGMVCVDCHTARELHGDGTRYKSMKQSGAMETKCEKCHENVEPIKSHKIHREKLDCKACHVRHVLSCANCHFDTMLKEGKKVAIPLSGWTFLMNYEGKVTSANMQTFVIGDDKTFILFAPNMSHSIMEKGRKCGDCHRTDVLENIKNGEVNLIWFEDGKTMNLKGTIPVVDGVNYKCVYQDYENQEWIPIEHPKEPLSQYAGFGEPLTQKQIDKLIKIKIK